jgi:hypothetical protein
MVVSIHVAGAEQMRILGAELRAMGEEGKVFRRGLLAGIRAAAAPAPEAAKASARALLPKRGGLNEYVASSRISVRNRLVGKAVGVRIAGVKGNHSLEDIDAGSVKHPVYGNRKVKWPTQAVTPGWYSKPMEATSPEVTAAVIGVILRARRTLERGL